MPKEIIIVFPGQGSQLVGMGLDPIKITISPEKFLKKLMKP